MSKLKTEYEHVSFERFSFFENDFGIRAPGALDYMGELSRGDNRVTLFVPEFSGAVRISAGQLRDILDFMEQLAGTPAKKGTEA